MARPAVASLPLVTLTQALTSTREQVLSQYVRHLNPRMINVYQFIGLDNLPVRAAGAYFWDSNGRQYTDVLSAFGTLAFGHNPPRLCAALAQLRASDYPNLVEGPCQLAGALAQNLAAVAPGSLQRVYFANSGTETVDAAIKMARAATGRAGIVACRKGYHGRSMAALSIMDRGEYRQCFEPLIPQVRFVDFGDIGQMAVALSTGDVGGVILEPMQGEAGMVPAPTGYLAAVRDLCTRHGTVLIFDEIQCGLGRTGRLFACDHDSVAPDSLLLGKALGGGVVALSALLVTDDLWRASRGDQPQSPFHVSTYGGNAAACAVGLAALEELFDEGLVERAAQSGEYLLGRLRDLQSRQPGIAAVRGRGLMVGIELSPPALLRSLTTGTLSHVLQTADARYLFSGLVLRQLIIEHGMVSAITLNNADVIRVQPPLNVDRDTIDRFVDALEATLGSMRNTVRTLFHSASDLIRYLRSNSAAYE